MPPLSPLPFLTEPERRLGNAGEPQIKRLPAAATRNAHAPRPMGRSLASAHTTPAQRRLIL